MTDDSIELTDDQRQVFSEFCLAMARHLQHEACYQPGPEARKLFELSHAYNAVGRDIGKGVSGD